MNYFAEMWVRLKSPTPTFFKKQRNLGLTLLGLGVFIASTESTFTYPDWVQRSAWILAVAGLVLSGQASMVVKDASTLIRDNSAPHEGPGPNEP